MKAVLNLTLLSLGLLLAQVPPSTSVSLYEYYVPGGTVSSGLVVEGSNFILNGKEIKIFSGAFHYFRVHPDHWRDTLRKLRAAGLNTVETYVAWNLHEPRQGDFDFGDLGEDMSPFTDIRTFVEIAQEEDLFVILRPGPYICAEWEFGGFPSWLLRDYTMYVRSYYETYRLAAERFLDQVLSRLVDLQFVAGGPIIAVQIENEFGSFGYDNDPRDLVYMDFLKGVIEANGYTNSLLFTSDNPTIYGDFGSLPGVLQTANFNRNPDGNLEALELYQPGNPKMVAEFWSGWYDSWTSSEHGGWDVEEFATMYEHIIVQNASVNLYMFIGGTNFGFLAGANELSNVPAYKPLVTSYDYDAPLTEAGDYTEKYDRIVEILSRLNPLQGIVDNPPAPEQRVKAAYGNFTVAEAIDFATLVAQAPQSFETVTGPVNMEALPMNNMNGQSYGYLLYSSTVPVGSNTTLTIRGHVRDIAQVAVNAELVTKPLSITHGIHSFGFWEGKDKSVTLSGDGSVVPLDILVENMGRVNYGPPHKYKEKKGLWEGPVLLDRTPINEWTMTPLEFKSGFVNGLTGWGPVSGPQSLPTLYRASVPLAAPLQDTFLDMRAWNKGVVFVNGFNVGRYWQEGPQRTLYVPAPLLLEGDNQIVVFEQYEAAGEISFIDVPILG